MPDCVTHNHGGKFIIESSPYQSIQWTAHLAKCTPEELQSNQENRKFRDITHFLHRMNEEEEEKTVKENYSKLCVDKSQAWCLCMTPH